MKLQPLGARVFAKPEPMVEKVGNIYIPEEYQEKCHMSTVVAIGPTWDIPHVKVGTKIITNHRGGHEMKVDGEDVTIFEEYDVIAIVIEGVNNGKSS